MENAHIFTNKDVKNYLETLGIEWDGQNATYNNHQSETINQIRYNYTLKVNITKPQLYTQGKADIGIYLTDASFIINIYQNNYDILGTNTTLNPLADATNGWIEYLANTYPNQIHYFKQKLKEEKQKDLKIINNVNNIFYDKESTMEILLKNNDAKYTSLNKILDDFENQNAK